MDSAAALNERKKRLAYVLPKCALSMLGLLVVAIVTWGTVLSKVSLGLIAALFFVYLRLLNSTRSLEKEAREARGREMLEERLRDGLMRRAPDDKKVPAAEWRKIKTEDQTWLEGQDSKLQRGDTVLRWERYGTSGGSDGLAVERGGKIVAMCTRRHLSFASQVAVRSPSRK